MDKIHYACSPKNIIIYPDDGITSARIMEFGQKSYRKVGQKNLGWEFTTG